MVERDTFKQKISEMSLTNAKTKLSKSKIRSQSRGPDNNEGLVLPGPKYDNNNNNRSSSISPKGDIKQMEAN